MSVCSYTRVHDRDTELIGVLVPLRASTVELAAVLHRLLDLVLGFDDLEGKAHRGVPSDVAMHEPDTGVVGLEGEDQVAAGAADWVPWHESHVTTGWVDQVQLDAAVVESLALCDDEEVVAWR